MYYIYTYIHIYIDIYIYTLSGADDDVLDDDRGGGQRRLGDRGQRQGLLRQPPGGAPNWNI